MKKRTLKSLLPLLLVALFAFSLTACYTVPSTLDTLESEYGIVVQGGDFAEGATLVSNEIEGTTEKAAEVLAAIADQSYNKEGNVYIFDIYVTKDGMEVQPNGKVKVSVPVPNAQAESYLVFHIKEDNSVEKLIPTVADGKISFETSSFSYFVIAEATPDEPTCTEHIYGTDGKCTVCGAECEHTEVVDAAVAPTCTEPGKTEGKHCSECNTVTVSQEEVPALGHDYKWVEGEKSTCVDEGTAPHYHCARCEKNFDENKSEIASVSLPLGSHEYGSMYWGKSASFWEDGNIEYYRCETCEKYFDAEYHEIETPVIPKYATNLSICVNGTPTALVIEEQTDSFICWSLEGLSVVKGDVITLCQTDNADIIHKYFAEGNVDADGRIRTTAGAASVLLHATPNGLMLFIDGYKYEGIVVEINGEQYPMVDTAYPDGTPTHIYGYVNFAVGDTFVVVDNVSGTVYDYDDLHANCLWDTWDFHRGEKGEFVIDYAARYGIEFDEDNKILIYKTFAPLDGSAYALTFADAETESVAFEQLEITKGSEGYEDVMWYMAHEDVVNNEDIVSYVGEKGLFVYMVQLQLAEGMKLNIKNLTANSIINAEHLVEVYTESGSITKDGDYVKVLKSGYYCILYLPCCNGFMIEEAENPADVYMYVDGEFIPLLKNAEGVVTYEGLQADTSTNIIFTDNTYTKYLPITLDSQTNSSIAHVFVYNGISMLYFDKAGTYDLSYHVETGVLSITSEGGSEEEPAVNYLYYLSVSGGSGETQTLSMRKNPTNTNEFCYQGAVFTANCYIAVIEMAEDASSYTTYGALAETDPSIAQSFGTAAMVKLAGTYDVYFDTVAKTIKLVAASDGSCAEGACVYGEGKVTKEPTHLEEGVKTYTCTVCGKVKEEVIAKKEGHSFGDWKPDETAEKHSRTCACGEIEVADCSYDSGKVTKEPTHLEEGVKTYTCTVCGRVKEEVVAKTEGHSFGDWKPDAAAEKHSRTCACGEIEVADCTYDSGKVTKEPTHLEEGVKTYTCTVCGRVKEEAVAKTEGHSFGEWKPDEVDETKHYKQCGCGEVETAECTFENGACTVCGREKQVEESGIIIVISGGTATFEGKKTVTSDSKLYGENATVYIAQANDVLNVKLTDQNGRTFKHWASATGTIIPDEDFSMLVRRSGYYYPIFEDVDPNAFADRVKIFEGNCEEGILYMSTNSKGDVKYELEFVNFGRHDFAELVNYNSQYHKQQCAICGEGIFEEHTEYSRETEKEPTHTEAGLRRYECYCGHVWTESIPATDEHSIDYDDWHIVEESKNGQYGKYRVYCKYCEYYEEYWYLGGLDFVSFIDGKMIHYQATYGGKVTHDEYYYSYRNAEGKKVYIWALQYEYAYASNADYNDTYIFMYIDDENPATIEPVYLSKSKGDRKAAYLWAIYGHVYDVNGWIDLLDYPDRNIGCSGGMVLGNSMSARASTLESYHNEWADTYNRLRIPTSRAYNDLSDTSWELYYEGKSFQGGYYDENDEYVTVGGRDTISFVKDAEESYKKYVHVDKATGMTYGYEDWGTSYRTVYIMRKYKTIVSPEEFNKLNDAEKSVHYSYGDIESDIKSLCAKRTAFNNFTLTVPEEASAFRLSVGFLTGDLVDLDGYYASVYYNTAQVFDSGKYITFTWLGEEGLVFDRYEIWDFVNQKWVLLSDSADFTFNTADNPRRDAAYIRLICHEVDVPAVPGETYRITVENGYFEIDGKEYTGTVEVEANTLVYVYANDVPGKTFEYWLDGNGEEFSDYRFTVTSDMSLRPVYTDTIYRIYCEGWNYDSYVSIEGGEMHYTDEFEGKAGDTFKLNTKYNPEYGCTVFLGWYLETYRSNGREYVLISDKQEFTYTITGEENGSLYAVWTTGENPFVKKYVDIRVKNGFVTYAGGEASEMFDNAYSAISLSDSGRVSFYDDPTDEIEYTMWDIAYRYELEGEVMHDVAESFESEYDYYPAGYWVENPEYCYPDGEINVTGIEKSESDAEEGVESVGTV